MTWRVSMVIVVSTVVNRKKKNGSTFLIGRATGLRWEICLTAQDDVSVFFLDPVHDRHGESFDLTREVGFLADRVALQLVGDPQHWRDWCDRIGQDKALQLISP